MNFVSRFASLDTPDTRDGPGPYVRQCMDGMEVVPGYSLREWIAASECGRCAPDARANHATLPQTWPVNQEPRARKINKPLRVTGGGAMPPIDHACADAVQVLVNCGMGFDRSATLDNVKQEAISRIAHEFAVREAMVAYGKARGIAQLTTLPVMDDPVAAANRVVEEACAALDRYKETLAREQTTGRYASFGGHWEPGR